MNIDKFGHHIHKRLRLPEFINTDTGDFDLKLSRLKGLQFPENDDEAVNKGYVDKSAEELRLELKKIHNDIKKDLQNLEKLTSEKLRTLYYTKVDINRILTANNK